jgi:hypothetical protein
MFPIPKYLNREAAAEFVSAQGIEVSERTLADLAYRGRGPKFAHVRGRCVYTQQWLMEWLEAEMARPVSVAHRRLPSSAIRRRYAASTPVR